MPCEERDKLLEKIFLAAAKTHSDAAHAMLGRNGETLERLTALAESARKAYEDCFDSWVDKHKSWTITSCPWRAQSLNNRSFSRIAAVAAFVLTAAQGVRAQGVTSGDCRNSDYRGVFGATALGNFIVPPPGIPAGPTARVGRVEVDGVGNVSISVTLSVAGVILKSDYSGTYTINPDCSAAVTLFVPFPGVPAPVPLNFTGMLADDGHQMDLILVDAPGIDDRILLQKHRKENCSNTDLTGTYKLEMSGAIINQSPNPVGTFLRVGRVVFDGLGGFTAKLQNSYNGVSSPESLLGTYSVDSQCAFTMNYELGQSYTWTGMLTDTNRGANLLVSDPPGAVITGNLMQK